MSRRKPKDAQHRSQKRKPSAEAARGREHTDGPRFHSRSLFLATCIGLGVLTAWLLLRDTPGKCLARARSLVESRPLEAAELVEQGIALAGGRHRELEMLRCQLLASQGRWVESLGGFSLLDQPEKCPLEDLLRFAENAGAAGEELLKRMIVSAIRKSQAPRNAESLRRQIALEEAIVSPRELIADCVQLSSLSPDDWFPHAMRGRAELQNGNPAGAAEALEASLSKAPPESEAQRIRSELVDRLLDVGDAAKARREIETLRAASADSIDFRLREAWLLRVEGKPQEALAALESAASLSPDATTLLFLRGILQLDEGDASGAIADLERVVEREPFRKEAHHKLAEAYRRTGSIEKSDEHLRRSHELTEWSAEILLQLNAISQNPQDTEAAARLSRLYALTGNPAAATRWAKYRPQQNSEEH